ncbi:hypothetical protein ACFVZC_29705 [Streptomyces marokkonensis]|uniref:Integral membrane protein n=1 Tax=Streptomyces marokkonensis TaxID=324855 RepID=A0ABW6QE71_9ACTN
MAVCLAFLMLSAALVPLTLPLGWDEIVYASRFSAFGPGVPFSAPRTRGVPFLLFPVASWSGSTVLLRIWMAALAGGALYLGFRPWLRVVRRPAAVCVGAGTYASLWAVLFYANSAMPNHYAAMGTCGAVGCFLRSRYVGVAAGVAVVTLMRPNDGAALAVPLVLAASIVPLWRGWGRTAAVAAGAAAGAVPWIVEARIRFGGVAQRLAEASDIQGRMRPVLSLDDHFTALDGPLLCRPCTSDGIDFPVFLWWILLPVLAALGLRTMRRPAPLQLAVAVALAAALPYLFLVPYAAPRFLFPSYALLALPAAVGLLALTDRARTSRLLATALAVVIVSHVIVQVLLAHAHAGIQQQARSDWPLIAEVLADHGVRTPCTIRGNSLAIPIAYSAGCRSEAMTTPGLPDAVVLRRTQPPRWAKDWPVWQVPGTYNPGWAVAVRP